MKRFINIGHQMYLTNDGKKEFSFYCTVKDCYERFNNEDVWNSVEDFKKDYLASGGDELDRYLALIPAYFIKENMELRIKEIKKDIAIYDRLIFKENRNIDYTDELKEMARLQVELNKLK